eukprot:02917.XXX_91063_91377_1 [CDS] Oithona nana genome sequencing.
MFIGRLQKEDLIGVDNVIADASFSNGCRNDNFLTRSQTSPRERIDSYQIPFTYPVFFRQCLQILVGEDHMNLCIWIQAVFDGQFDRIGCGRGCGNRGFAHCGHS